MAVRRTELLSWSEVVGSSNAFTPFTQLRLGLNVGCGKNLHQVALTGRRWEHHNVLIVLGFLHTGTKDSGDPSKAYRRSF